MIKKARKFQILIVLSAMLFMFFSFTACSDDNAKKYSLPDVAVGDTFEITLDAHGGTAYSWDYKIIPSSGVEYVTMEYIPTNDDPDIIGGGQLKYTFRAIKAGSYKIEFQLQIPWESKPPVETNIYEVKVVK